MIDEWPAFAFTARLEAAKQNLPAMPFRLPGGSDLLAGQQAVALPGPEQDPAVAEASPRWTWTCSCCMRSAPTRRAMSRSPGPAGWTPPRLSRRARFSSRSRRSCPTGVLGTLRNSFVLPRHFVHALSVVPGGAYPTSCLPSYTADFAAAGAGHGAVPAAARGARPGRADAAAGGGGAHP